MLHATESDLLDHFKASVFFNPRTVRCLQHLKPPPLFPRQNLWGLTIRWACPPHTLIGHVRQYVGFELAPQALFMCHATASL